MTAIEAPALFPAEPYRIGPEPLPDSSSGARRRNRQALRIALGLHPLSIRGMRIPLHPEAPRDASREDGRDYPRCGSCRFRELVSGNSRAYPKCLVGYIPPDVTSAPRYSGGADTDVRRYWPACVNYAPRDQT